MTDWAARLTAPYDAVAHGIKAADASFRTVHEGPLTFDRIDYPAAQVYVDEFARSDTINWTYTITAALYFEVSRGMDFGEDIAHPVAHVITESLAALSEVDHITNYHPSRINFFSGEPNNDLVLAVMVDFQASVKLDSRDFGQ